MHKILVVITVLAFISGILDLILNVAILTKVSNENAFKAVGEVYSHKVITPTPSPTIVITPTASVSAAPTKLLLKSITPTPVKKAVLSPVPSHATISR